MTEREAEIRAAFVREALSWVGTPFREKACIKGRNGAVDCGQLLRACAIDSGLVPDFPMPDYDARYLVHHEDPKFLEFLTLDLGMVETLHPKIGDVHVYKWGRSFVHGAIRISTTTMVHAYAAIGMVIETKINDPLVTHIPVGSEMMPRPVKYFDVWSSR